MASKGWKEGTTVVAMTAIVVALAGCEEPPPEPPARRKPAAAAPTAAPALSYRAPPTWVRDKTATSGVNRDRYRIPTAGDAVHPATLVVQRLGRGTRAVDVALDELTEAFEGRKAEDGKREPKVVRRERVDGAALPTTLLEIRGTYRFPLGPQRGGRAAAEVLKEDWVALAATVTADDGARWLFRLVGPSDTVDGARSAFRSMVAAAHPAP
ncbi:MAG: hypothetical protein AAF715_28355 [Myxococcota bacterium]